MSKQVPFMVIEYTISRFSYTGAESLYLLGFIAVILLLRIRRSIKGQKFRMYRVIVYPFIYLAISVYSYYLDPSLILAILFIILVFLGLIVGDISGGNIKFFDRDEKTYYKRSSYISTIWTVSFISRIALEVYYPSSFLANSAITLILVFTTGLLIGEGINIYMAYKIYRGSIKSKSLKR